MITVTDDTEADVCCYGDGRRCTSTGINWTHSLTWSSSLPSPSHLYVDSVCCQSTQAPWYSDGLIIITPCHSRFLTLTRSIVDEIAMMLVMDIRELLIAHELIGGLGEDEVVCVIIAG